MRRAYLLVLSAFFGCAGKFVYVPGPPSHKEPALPETALAPFTFEGYRFKARARAGAIAIACPVLHKLAGMPQLPPHVLDETFLAQARASGAFRSVRLLAEPERGREKLSLQIAVNECAFRYRPAKSPAYEFSLGLRAQAVTLTDGRVVWQGQVRRAAAGDWTPPGAAETAALLGELYRELIRDLAAGVQRD